MHSSQDLRHNSLLSPNPLPYKSSTVEYFGRSGGLIFNVKKYNSGFSISKNYGNYENKCNVNWYFGKYGRISYMNLFDGIEKNLTKILSIGNDEEKWNIGFAGFLPIPDRIESIKAIIGTLPFPQNYEKILALGHIFSREISENISSNRIFELGRRIRTDQLPLTELKNDRVLSERLSEAGSLVPSIIQSNELLQITYTPNIFQKPKFNIL